LFYRCGYVYLYIMYVVEQETNLPPPAQNEKKKSYKLGSAFSPSWYRNSNRTLCLSHTYTHIHTHAVTLSLSLSQSLTHTHTVTHSLTHTHTHAVTHTHSHSLTHIHTQAESLTYTYTHMTRKFKKRNCLWHNCPKSVRYRFNSKNHNIMMQIIAKKGENPNFQTSKCAPRPYPTPALPSRMGKFKSIYPPQDEDENDIS